MNRYAIDHSRGRVVLPAADADQARAKMAKLYGAGQYEPIQLPTVTPATGVATTPKTMSKKNEKKTPKKQASVRAKAKAAKAPKKAAKPANEGMSGLDAAALVLKEAKAPMTAKEVVAEIQRRNLAPKLGGKTPDATIYAAMLTEIKKKGEASRFGKNGPSFIATANA